MISEPKIIVYCDRDDCGYTDEFGLTATARGWDARGLDGEIRSAGWTIISDNEHRCPNCTKDRQEANA